MHDAPLETLERTFDMPVVAIASRWRDAHAVDFDRDAVRIFADVLGELRTEDDIGEIALFLLGRGGHPSFADGVCRLLDGFDLEWTCLIPRVVDGAYTLLALAADEIVVHPYGGLGPFDAPPSRRLGGRLDLETLSALERRGLRGEVDEERVPEVAETAHFQHLARRHFDRLFDEADTRSESRVAEALGWERLGRQLALSAPELDTLGLPARSAGPEEREAMWSMHGALEATLDLRGPRPERYTESEYGEEVEFEPAEWVAGGLIESSRTAILYELDTGKPDPDTNMFDGAWARPEEPPNAS
jgi:hypothetical protein